MPITLSEAQSKALLSAYSIPFAPEVLADSPERAAEAARGLGFPVAMKLCGANIAHKTERGLVRLGVATSDDAHLFAEELLAAALPDDGVTGVLVAPMIQGDREVIAGLNRDPQFGPTVVFGVGGVLTEVLSDAVIRLVPLSSLDAHEMITGIAHHQLLDEFRGQPEVDKDAIAAILLSLSRLALEHPEIVSVDLNPIIISEGKPVAVDALVEVLEDSETSYSEAQQ